MFCDCQRFELKKIGDLTEDDLREDNTDEVVAGAYEDRLEETKNALQSDDKEQHTGTPRTITASKILKANLACQCHLSIVFSVWCAFFENVFGQKGNHVTVTFCQMFFHSEKY